MKLLDKYIFFTRHKVRKKIYFTYFEITLIQIHFAKTTLGFSVITKIPFLLVLYIFKKLHKNTHELYTNKHIFHTNKIFA
jgi:hypothetical protein